MSNRITITPRQFGKPDRQLRISSEELNAPYILIQLEALTFKPVGPTLGVSLTPEDAATLRDFLNEHVIDEQVERVVTETKAVIR
jgi:hypothetical protein